MQSMQEIIPGLYCGSYHPAADKATLEAAGITHILCCIGTSPRFPDSFSYLTIATDDRPDFNIEPFFARTFEFIENALVKEHKKVLVHCGAGISRAPSVVCAYLIRKITITRGGGDCPHSPETTVCQPQHGFYETVEKLCDVVGDCGLER
ncbi:slingshot [Angomonas deanei]|uniref:Dual specificity phosphatase, catalytic domain containing protein, putative n=1 Tax=Angomonas deanei TaxID=59799 RepID=A0A7G2CR89_9TRYP|nr:slingshot [Angomonas deanei]CAD2221521.1 Dual specificity phosphatase, catalytic domain containing protein, putative [Angomonas deanei]|eukprot:EPY26351.1 slingshot [Angomonas deanei]